MTELARLRQLFEQLVDTTADFQAEKIKQLRVQDAELATELAALLHIENGSTPTLNKVVKQSMLGVFDRAETAGYLDKQIGRYRLLNEIGRGGMSVVFKDVRTDGDLEQHVALKILRKGLIDQKSIDRFQRERKFLANLQHPNICGFVDSGTVEDGTPYLVLELIKGQDLLDFARQLQLSIERRVQLFQHVLSGVAYAHKSLVIHLDLKPSNVLVDQHGTPKLLDFGIANSVKSDTHRETEQWFTAQYGAPEQLLGKPLTTRCDLYSAGVILFELLTGRPPFELDGKSAAEVENTILSVPAPLMRLQTSARDELDCVVQKALRKEPEARYQTAEEFSQDLSCWLNKMPVRAKGSHTSYRVKKFIQRHRALVAASVLIAVVIIVSISMIVNENSQARTERDRATLALSILTDAFIAADPLQSSRGEMTVRDVLKSSANQLLKLESTYPKDFVQIGAQIAALQIKLGLTRDGQNLAARAYEKALMLNLEQERIALNRSRIRAEIVLGERDKAKALIAQESSEQARNHPEFLMLQADTLTYDDTEIAEKQRLLEASVAGFEKQLEHPAAISAHARLAELHYRAHRAKQAMDTATATLEKFKRRFGASHPSVLRAQFDQLNLKEMLDQDENVIFEAMTLLPIVSQTFGEGSTTTAAIHSLLAHSYRKLKLPVEAVKHNRIAVKILAAALGEDHESTLRERLNVAITLKSLPNAGVETIAEFTAISRAAMTSTRVADNFRHYAIAYAALYFQSIGKFDLALETLAHPNYRRDLIDLSEAARKDFAQDLLAIGSDAGCSKASASGPKTLCYANPSAKCLTAVKRYCALIEARER